VYQYHTEHGCGACDTGQQRAQSGTGQSQLGTAGMAEYQQIVSDHVLHVAYHYYYHWRGGVGHSHGHLHAWKEETAYNH
jgi:hypothetical protein